MCFYRRIRRIAGMRTEAPSPDVRIADRPCGLHRRFGYRRFLVSPVRPIAGFVLEALSPEFPSPEPHIAGRSIAGRFLMCYRRVSKSGDEIRRYQAASHYITDEATKTPLLFLSFSPFFYSSSTVMIKKPEQLPQSSSLSRPDIREPNGFTLGS